MRSFVVSMMIAALGGLTACGPTASDDADSGPPADATADGPCSTGSVACAGNALQTCQGGSWLTLQTCPAACVPQLGCVECVPGTTVCDGNDRLLCTATGSPGSLVEQCVNTCQAGECIDPCADAVASRSYIGCEYWPTVTMNSFLPLAKAAFHFAVVVANAADTDTTITVEGGALGAPVTETVAPQQLRTITLPWVPALRQQYVKGAQNEGSALVPGGAYHLVSSQPVTVYQFNALEYRLNNQYSTTNDASLLLPTHALADAAGTSTYLVMAFGSQLTRMTLTGETNFAPGFFTVVATQDATQVDVTFTAHTIAGSGVAGTYGPGDAATFMLDAGGVLEIASANDPAATCSAPDATFFSYCAFSAGYDLTGTAIVSDKPIAVFGGHDCANVPFDRMAGDHLEEQLFPVNAWGKHYVATRAVATALPNLWRVLSGHDGNTITFDPAVHDPVVLNKGEWVEFGTLQDFEATGTAAFMLAGYMVGQGSALTSDPGDPSMTLAVPVEQYRTEYRFLAPESYEQNYVSVVAKGGATVLLDGTALSGWAAIGSSGYVAVGQAITGGSHRITTDGTDGFGIQVYGVGNYTSYMYPGGLDIKVINVPE
jgi:hypothetical protein